MSEHRVIAQRTDRDDEGEFTVGLRAPYQDGNDWICEIFTEGLDAGNLSVGGIDALQSIRLAVDMLDALIKTRPSAEAYGITGRF
ncbi:hypothetical protein QP888_02315 [Corynebacterium sp. MSK297]|uniref:DUF6968 family protein n=1 Tax=Corynebacterium sp. MSK297 TaxID=3050221 RepID=UPI00254AD379|nr:hypothetical protein [Corynebacterium sp. MSK297]MDK8845362.1 hypothetical protein [Corynebacterium sp. MSK297]